jgi:four helix bundle protein
MKSHLYPFEKLDVWQSAKDFVLHIFKTAEQFPDREKYGLVSQITRAAVSVASNIAEGSSRFGFKDQAHFMEIAYSSLMETACQLIIVRDLEYVSIEEYMKLRLEIEEISNKLNALHRSLHSRENL